MLMRKTVIRFVVAVLSVPAVAGAQSGVGDETRLRARSVYIVQQAPPQPPRPPRPTRVERGQDGREEQRESFTKSARLGANGILDISNLVGNVEISRGSGNDATIEVTKIARARTQEEARALLPLVTVEVTSRGDRTEIRTNYPEREAMREHRNFNVAVHFKISAPQGTRVTARSVSGNLRATDIRGELSLITTSGNVEISNAARVTAAKSTSGNIDLTNIDSDVALDAGTVSGNVVIRSAKARRMELGTVSGSVIVQDVETERLGAQTLSGNVEFTGPFAKGGRYELKSHSGNVVVKVTGGSGFAVEANSWSGNVHSDFAIGGSDHEPTRGRRKLIRGVVGDGSAVVNITTFSGNVQLVKR
jgi:Putative adhesin